MPAKKLTILNVTYLFFLPMLKYFLFFLSFLFTSSHTKGIAKNTNSTPVDTLELKARGLVRYSDFGAVGDGKTDDMQAIAATHSFANQHNLPVQADDEASYYIGGKAITATVKTDTDFGNATFIIDDTNVENRNASIFSIASNKQPYTLGSLSRLKKNQKKINGTFPGACLITVTNSHVKHYIRFGLNPTNGSAQTDIFIVDQNGNVDMSSPIIWDFHQITDVTVLPIDSKKLQITGGNFITRANRAESKYTYYSRNIAIKRSHVVIDGLTHRIEGEGEQGAPYSGFIHISDCAYVTVKNTTLTGHKTYRTIGRAGKPVSMGTYDLSVSRALNVSFVNCRQTNDINDRQYWGIIGSNYSKNLLYDSCSLSRFDAHKGVANATIRNSTLGHMGINAIGTGTFTVENSTIRGRSIINLRSDYGSTWNGEIIIRDCTFVPANGQPANPYIISGYYSGQHDFGYTCYMPKKITIENLHIDDANHPDDYKGPAIFSNFNSENTTHSYKEKYPYIKTKKVLLKNITTSSGKTLRVSDNRFMFKGMKIIHTDEH